MIAMGEKQLHTTPGGLYYMHHSPLIKDEAYFMSLLLQTTQLITWDGKAIEQLYQEMKHNKS